MDEINNLAPRERSHANSTESLQTTRSPFLALDLMPQPLLSAVTTIVQACRRAGVIAAGHFPVSQVVRSLYLYDRVILVRSRHVDE